MESLSMVSHTNALIKNRETIDINLYEQFIKYLDASPITDVSCLITEKRNLAVLLNFLFSNFI